MSTRTNRPTVTASRGRGKPRDGTARAPVTRQVKPPTAGARKGPGRPPTPIPAAVQVETPPPTPTPKVSGSSVRASDTEDGGAYYEFTNKTADAGFMCNDYEAIMLMDGETFASVTAFVMYCAYKANGNEDHAKHVQQQRSSMYCRMYWKRNSITPTDELRSIARSAMIRAVASKFICNDDLAEDLLNFKDRMRLRYKLRTEGPACISEPTWLDRMEESELGGILGQVSYFVSGTTTNAI